MHSDAATVKQLQAMGHKIDLPGNVAAGGRGSSHVGQPADRGMGPQGATSCLAAATAQPGGSACRAGTLIRSAGRRAANQAFTETPPLTAGLFCFLAII
jgi:hypothetical protein